MPEYEKEKIIHAIDKARHQSQDNVKEIAMGSEALNRLYALFATSGVTVCKDKADTVFGIPIVDEHDFHPDEVEIRLNSGLAYYGVFNEYGWILTSQAWQSREDYVQVLRRKAIEERLFPLDLCPHADGVDEPDGFCSWGERKKEE